MGNIFGDMETNLGRAAWAAVLAIAGFAAISTVLAELGQDPKLGLLFALAGFLFVAWFMAKAARAQGRSAMLYGVISLIPPLAIYALIWLYNSETRTRLARADSRHDA